MEGRKKKHKCLLFTWFPLLFPQLGFRVQGKISAFAVKVMWEEHPTRPTTIHLNLQSHKDNDSATCRILVLLSGGYACPASRSAASGRVKTRPPLPALVSETPLITNVGQKKVPSAHKSPPVLCRTSHSKQPSDFILFIPASKGRLT